MSEKFEQYELKPIGELISSNNEHKIKVVKKYVPALKNMDLFSHILIFIKKNNGSKDTQPSGFNNQLHIHTAQILSVKGDEIELAPGSLGCKANVYDIKPYFPCVDRVKDAIVPDNKANWDKRKPHCRDFNSLKDQSTSINQVGIVTKHRGQYTLSLPNYSDEELESLSKYSHLKVVWLFSRYTSDRFKRILLVDPPYENAPKSGIFATRSPVRPNPIAITTVRVLEVNSEAKTITVNNIDAFNNTPILDVFPYIPQNDLILDCQVPSYLAHWPAWYQDTIEEFKIGSSLLPISNSEIIKKYSSATVPSNLDKQELADQTLVIKHHDQILIKGAKQNNLKNIDVAIPKNKLTVITGVSGSGKSSLAFDTLFAESQRRFLDNMSGSGGSFSGLMKKSNVDQISGLPPAIAIKQNAVNRNIRSTVGTITDINNFLRVLFSKVGSRRCPRCGKSVDVYSVGEINRIISGFKAGTKLELEPFNYPETLLSITIPENQQEQLEQQIKEAVSKGLDLGKGAIRVLLNDSDEVILQTKSICYYCDYILFEMTSSDFSFNNPESMCSECNGLGVILEVDPELIVARPHLSILDKGSDWWGNLRRHRKKPNANWMKGEILALADEMNIDLELPWCDLPQDFRHQAVYGSDGRIVSFVYENSNGRKGEINRPVEGAFNTINRLFKSGKGSAEHLEKNFMRNQTCPKCQGERLNTASRLVAIADTRFPEAVSKTIAELNEWVNNVHVKLLKRNTKIAGPVLQQISKRLQNLIDVGVSYLSLNRSVPTLSGGEQQRIRLASQLNNGLSDLLYILDEPSTGLHAYDNKKLINTLLKIRDNGNTVIVVEHDREAMLASDHIIDMGPGAGINGGRVVAEGSKRDITQIEASATGRYLINSGPAEMNTKNNLPKTTKWLSITGVSENNLKSIDVAIPLGVTTCITGVSGSGKSTLLLQTLYPALQKALGIAVEAGGRFKELRGLEHIDNVLRISQTPIGRTPRSNAATYTGVFDEIRILFAKTESVRELKYKKSHFSFNSKDGQCVECKGEGRKCIRMHFMSDIWVECENCKGQRYKEEVLKVKYNNKNIADILNMDIDEANNFFKGYQKITGILQTLCDVGLGYLKMGQSALTLSGGEAQRVKLAKELSKPNTGKTIYILDEPTTGLHFEDIKKLSKVFDRIIKDGNSLLIIEHNLDVIMNADWVIDLGPLGGDKGGTIVAAGTPQQIMDDENSLTGEMLRKSYCFFPRRLI